MKHTIIEDLSSWEFIQILDSITDAVFIDDAQGYTLWCNKACTPLYKISPQEVIGVHVNDLEQQGIFSPSVARVVLEDGHEATIIHKNKEGRTLLSSGTPILDEKGKIRKVITTSRDITELALLQEELKGHQSPKGNKKSHHTYFEHGLVATSQSMFHVLQLAQKLASVDSTVLLSGESGVGKGLISKFLHDNGKRKNKPFITVNCGAIPANLIESELFGYVKGAFTGARSGGKEGLFQSADSGTIFLDEISELPLNLQVTLLQAIQDRVITPVGSTQSIPIDVRVISATNKDLHQLVQSGKFREDLYYRLNVVPISIPPLRKRKEDIPPLIEKFLNEYNIKYKEEKEMHPKTVELLQSFSWPGNIRELQNIVERLILTTSDKLITVNCLPDFLINEVSHDQGLSPEPSLAQAMDYHEKEILTNALTTYGSTRAMAKALKISQPTVVRKLKKHGLSPSDS